ncbi:MAG: helix-turn-helix domain-containing protein [Bacteroidota bacterium]
MEKLEPYILLVISGQGTLLSLALLMSIFKKKYANFFLGLITAVITIEIMTLWAIRMQLTNSDTMFPFWLLGTYLTIPPALWLFVQVNLNPTFSLKYRYLWIFVPALLEIVVESMVHFTNVYWGTNYHIIDNTFWFVLTEVIPVLALAVVVIWFGVELEKIKKEMTRSGSASNHRGFGKLYAFLGFFAVMTFFWILQAFYIAPVVQIIEALLICFVFILGYFGYFQPSFLDVPKVAKKEIINRTYPQFSDRKELVRLQNLFEEDRIHTQQKLSINEVARELDLPERYLSALINIYYNTNFNAFVNKYRVKEAIERIQDPNQQNKNLLGIAMDSGFSSKSSFNQNFKDSTGKKPSDFLEK